MAAYIARWRNGSSSVDVDLFDPVGPLNNYRFSDPNAVVPSTGDYTNQTQKAVPLSGGWVMNDFDNSNDYPTDGSATGTGEVDITNVGTFPQGAFVWTIIGKL